MMNATDNGLIQPLLTVKSNDDDHDDHDTDTTTVTTISTDSPILTEENLNRTNHGDDDDDSGSQYCSPAITILSLVLAILVLAPFLGDKLVAAINSILFLLLLMGTIVMVAIVFVVVVLVVTAWLDDEEEQEEQDSQHTTDFVSLVQIKYNLVLERLMIPQRIRQSYDIVSLVLFPTNSTNNNDDLEEVPSTENNTVCGEEDRDGPISLSPPAAMGSYHGDHHDDLHHPPPMLKNVASFLYQYIHKWQFLFLPPVPMVVLVALYSGGPVYCIENRVDLYESFQLYFFIITIHLLLLWGGLLVLPLQQNLKELYPGMELSDLKLTFSAFVLIFFFYRVFLVPSICWDDNDDGEARTAFQSRLSTLLWLAVTLKFKNTYFCPTDRSGIATSSQKDDIKKKCFNIFALVCAITSPLWSMEVLVTMIISVGVLLLCIGVFDLVTRYSGLLTGALAKVCPCVPIQAIKVLELNEEELEEDKEEAVQARVEDQILHLGRPMSTSANYLKRGQNRFMKATIFLAVWVLLFVFKEQFAVKSNHMEPGEVKPNFLAWYKENKEHINAGDWKELEMATSSNEDNLKFFAFVKHAELEGYRNSMSKMPKDYLFGTYKQWAKRNKVWSKQYKERSQPMRFGVH